MSVKPLARLFEPEVTRTSLLSCSFLVFVGLGTVGWGTGYNRARSGPGRARFEIFLEPLSAHRFTWHDPVGLGDGVARRNVTSGNNRGSALRFRFLNAHSEELAPQNAGGSSGEGRWEAVGVGDEIEGGFPTSSNEFCVEPSSSTFRRRKLSSGGSTNSWFSLKKVIQRRGAEHAETSLCGLCVTAVKFLVETGF